MSDRKTSQYTRTTDIISGDIIEIVRTTNGSSDDANLAMEKADFDAYIEGVAEKQYTTLIIADGANGTVLLGDKTEYESFTIPFLIGYDTKRFSGSTKVLYNTIEATILPPEGIGDDELVDGVTVNPEQVIESGNNLLWKISNNSGENLTIKYKITESKPAL